MTNRQFTASTRERVRVSSLTRPSSDHALLERSALHREYLAERDEILRLKWLESEKVGRDIGLDHARAIWIANHRARWIKSRRAAAQAN